MILSGLAALLVKLIQGFLMLFPAWTPPALSPEWTALSAANIVLPLGTWAMLSGLTVAVMLAGLSLWALKMAFNMIRGSGA